MKATPPEQLPGTRIAVNGGFNPINGFVVQTVVCAVVCEKTLEILDVENTHNKAQTIVDSLYVDRNVCARAIEIRFYCPALAGKSIKGMKADRFEHFVQNYHVPAKKKS